MTVPTPRRRRLPAALTIAMAALAVGAVLGGPRSGFAAAAAAPAAVTAPTISGTFQETVTVTATTGTWSGSPTSYTYFWERCDSSGASCSTIAGQTSAVLQLQAADVGHTIRIVVTATNGGGSAQATSDPSPLVASQNGPGNSALPTLSGTARETLTLTATTGTWTNSPTSYTYAWQRCDANGTSCSTISGASGPSTQLHTVDVGSTIRVTVTAANASGSAAATSAPSAVVVSQSAVSAPVSTVAPQFSGTATIGSTLTGTQGTWSNSPTSWSYFWSRCDSNGNACAAISGATGTTYVLTQSDVGSTLRYSVIATNSAGSSEATSAPSAVVGATHPATTTTTTTTTPTPTPTPTPTTTTAPPSTSGCPGGTGTIQVSDLAAPARLSIDQQTVTPGVVTPSAASIQIRFRVTACGGRPVQGATAYAAAVPYNQYAVGQTTTDANGIAIMAVAQQAGFPASSKQQLLVVFCRATKPGDPALGGVSTRRLVSFPVRLS